MTKRSLKLSAGLLSLMATGCAGGAAQAEIFTSKPFKLMTFFNHDDSDGASGVSSASDATDVSEGAAQTTDNANITPPPPPVKGEDGLYEDGAFITADEVLHPEDNVIVARGNVEMRYEGRLIRADEIHYNQLTGETIATGNTQTINEDGSVQFADRLVVDNKKSTAQGDRIASMETDKSKVFANKVERIDENISRLSEVIFTPCELCVKNNVTQNPTWSIQASEITQNKKTRIVSYRNAIFKARGIPVFYMPILWHADPTTKRASGFLMPKVGVSKRRGTHLELPYLWAVSPYTDIIISPRFSTKLNPFLNLEVNRKFFSGDFNSRFGFTNEAYFDGRGNRIGEAENKGYILADGRFDISKDWRWAFTAQHVFDQKDVNLVDRYKVDSVFNRQGVFSTNSRQLINQLNLIRQNDNSYVNASLVSFQSLQYTGGAFLPDGSFRPRGPGQSSLPAVAPMIEAYYSPKQNILGGRFSLSANAVSVLRQRTPQADIAVNATGPVDSARLSLSTSWRRDMVMPIGLKIAPFFEARHDQYRLNDFDTVGTSYEVNRSLSTAGLELSYPLIRRNKSFTTLIEPVVQMVASPQSRKNQFLTNEDSLAFEFDETTLFKGNRSPGFDLYEGGKRLNLGLRGEFNFDTGLKISGLLGRSFRDKVETSFQRTQNVGGQIFRYDPSGLAAKSSDWIVQADFNTGTGIFGYGRTRLNGETGALRRGELGLSIIKAKSLATLRYIVDQTDIFGPNGPLVVNGKLKDDYKRYENVSLSAQHFFSDRWGVAANINRNIKSDSWVRSELSLIFKDDCTRVDIVYQYDDTLAGIQGGRASSSLGFRISLATLTTTESDFSNIR
jgi:LPS-assembly protein